MEIVTLQIPKGDMIDCHPGKNFDSMTLNINPCYSPKVQLVWSGTWKASSVKPRQTIQLVYQWCLEAMGKYLGSNYLSSKASPKTKESMSTDICDPRLKVMG